MDTEPITDPTLLTGAPFMLKDGTIVCQFEVNKHEWDKTKFEDLCLKTQTKI